MKRSYIQLGGLLALFLVPFGTAMSAPEWVNLYDGAGNGEDTAAALTIGSNFNAYVAGGSTGESGDLDYVTVKYNNSGDELWLVHYDGPGAGEDIASDAIANGYSGVIVTGSSAGSSSSDYATIKYDENGNEEWVARYDGPEGDWDDAYKVGIDAAGNVYVTGASMGAFGAGEIATVKYDADGNELWAARYTAGDDYNQEPSDMFVSSDGTVYVTGLVGLSADEDGASYDYITLKYGTDGVLAWSMTFNGEGTGIDEATSVAVDGSGNVFVTGVSEGSSSGFDYATVKYDSSGSQLWASRYDGGVDGEDVPLGLELDSNGSIIVTGLRTSASNMTDFATVKYDTSGGETWVSIYDGPGNGVDEALSLSIDSANAIYVTGPSWAGADESTTGFATIKYSAGGIEEWVERYDVADSAWAEPVAIGLDDNGKVFVAGAVYNGDTNLEMATISYFGASTDAEETMALLPTEVALMQNAPNPVVATTAIRFALPTRERVRVRVFDTSGREVAVVMDRVAEAGWHRIDWAPDRLAAGVYMYRLETESKVQTKKLTVLK